MNASSSTATTTPTTIHLVLVTVTPPVGFCVDVTTERHCRPVRVKRFGKPNSLPEPGGDDPFHQDQTDWHLQLCQQEDFRRRDRPTKPARQPEPTGERPEPVRNDNRPGSRGHEEGSVRNSTSHGARVARAVGRSAYKRLEPAKSRSHVTARSGVPAAHRKFGRANLSRR
jgi:hypothetical protein